MGPLKICKLEVDVDYDYYFGDEDGYYNDDDVPECIPAACGLDEPSSCEDVTSLIDCVGDACADDETVAMILGIFKACFCDADAEACSMMST